MTDRKMYENVNYFGIYTIHDKLANVYSPIFMQKNDKTAIRMFENTKKDNIAYTDQQLIRVGYYNIKDGTLYIDYDGGDKPYVSTNETIYRGNEVVA